MTPPGVDANVDRRDETFFNLETGTLTAYAGGILVVNAVWTAWRVAVLLVGWYVALYAVFFVYMRVFLYLSDLFAVVVIRIGLWIVSGQECAGTCGPRSCWEEERVEKQQQQQRRRNIIFSNDSTLHSLRHHHIRLFS